ncbi:MAG: tRNA (adenosine(37)-N6)-dimethylallyltransferase MiaA [Clostridia bacterium]|nr:tRNA (adenosine(37)-N6)-dimethylallyltransferase MiaA [Clostridia bacterium]
MDKKIPLIVVAGPTASGKTSLGVELAKRLDGEVVSADSMQIYKGMDIASAMPAAEEMQGVPHHMLAILSQGERYSVAAYCEQANKCIADIVSRGKQPIVVGGTGLYISSLVDNIEFTQESTDLGLREKLSKRLETEGAAALLEELRTVDPETAARLHENDTKRILRALELYQQTGVTITDQTRQSRLHGSPYNPLIIGLNAHNREYLYERINRRVGIMAENGLVQEAERCLGENTATAAQAIGHKELMPYFSGEMTLDEALDNLRMQTRRYAKRQLTWLRRDERVRWLYIDEYAAFGDLADAAYKLCADFLSEGGE